MNNFFYLRQTYLVIVNQIGSFKYDPIDKKQFWSFKLNILFRKFVKHFL